jgi:hypothetical protein
VAPERLPQGAHCFRRKHVEFILTAAVAIVMVGVVVWCLLAGARERVRSIDGANLIQALKRSGHGK